MSSTPSSPTEGDEMPVNVVDQNDEMPVNAVENNEMQVNVVDQNDEMHINVVENNEIMPVNVVENNEMPVNVVKSDEMSVNVVESESSKVQLRKLRSQRSERRKSITSNFGDRRNLAAVKLQKVYKSFRTRRQLADCAVLAEQKWWQVLDLAELKHSSISFFDIEKPESVLSKWSRARTRAAKVGKGLSKDEKARKLALQHWLEAIDPRHRYGHNLQFYYVRWLHCESKQPFFYWLDIGDGREVNIVERCPRSRLQQQCIKYLDSAERDAYEVIVEEGKLVFKANKKAVDTTEETKGAKWIFVLSVTKTLYVGQKIKGNFQHSSFLAGGATLSAGRLVAENGSLTAVWPHSGHYLPTEENFQAFMSFLTENDVDLTRVKRAPVDDEEEFLIKSTTSYMGQLRTDEQTSFVQYETQRRQQVSKLSQLVNSSILRRSKLMRAKIARLDIPSNSEIIEEEFKTPTQPPESSPDYNIEEDFSSSDGYETAEDSLLSEDDFIYPKLNIFQTDDNFEDEEPIPQEAILHRINSHKRTRSYQLGEHLNFRWTTGAGPRIGCVRDYPSKLQFQVLEQVNLSPKSSSSDYSPLSTESTPSSSGLRKETITGKSNLCPDTKNVILEDP
ncbi:hypothetical protein RND81_14G058000 [Saponaria officinalis]|uniref:Calmodulin-binding protein n=1 Tax=Saponaria officinalis TaxID=3572 RepID=A0AAW1GUS5_SAPOF